MPLVTTDATASLGGPRWLVDRRAEAAEVLDAQGLPSSREEVWRYSPIDDLEIERYVRGAAMGRAVVPSALIAGAGSVLEIDADGGIGSAVAPSGVTITALSAHPEGADLLGAATAATDPIVALSTATTPDGVVIDVEKGTLLAEPIVIVRNVATGVSSGRTIVRLAEGAIATVLEVHIGGEGDSLSLPVAELFVADAANLRYGSVQLLGRSAWHLATINAIVGRDATVSQLTAGLGAHYDRLRTDTVLAGQGASSVLRSTYLGDGEQIHDLRTMQDHVAPKTISDLLCKGAVADTARSVYTGLIRMRHGAVRSNANQSNHNLVLSETAHADSVPNLDISENDVRCSHASTVGPIDEDQRFYLESRGIERAAAERLLVRGFFADLLERSDIGPAGPVISADIEHRLAGLEVR